MANRVQNIVLRVPVTAQEREMIALKTQQMGTRCFSVYARIMLIDGYVFILCTDRTNVEAEYALGGLSNNIFASRYTYVIPNKEELIAQVEAVLREWHEPEADGEKED